MSWGRGGGSRSGVIRWKVCPPAVRVLKYSRRVTRSINGKSLLGKMAEREREREKRKKNSNAANATRPCALGNKDG